MGYLVCLLIQSRLSAYGTLLGWLFSNISRASSDESVNAAMAGLHSPANGATAPITSGGSSSDSMDTLDIDAEIQVSSEQSGAISKKHGHKTTLSIGSVAAPLPRVNEEEPFLLAPSQRPKSGISSFSWFSKDGKGGKDRVLMLPQSLLVAVRAQLSSNEVPPSSRW